MEGSAKAMMHRLVTCVGVMVLVAALAAGLAGCRREGAWKEPQWEKGQAQPELPKVMITVGRASLEVEVANDLAKRRDGYMYRDKPEAGGMLFVYPQEQPMSYHMKNVKFDIDIAFITEEGRINQIEHMKAFMITPRPQLKPGQDPQTLSDVRTWDSMRPAKYALEVPAGWFGDNGVKVGDQVTIPAEVKATE
jgi:uncharacterized membrane protein (UPF0127 family)